MKRKLILILVLLFCLSGFSQHPSSKYWIQFTDKNSTPYSISEPSLYLSQKAIDRRNRQGISIVQNDLPVNSWYIDSVRGTGVRILNRSKWFNSVTIQTNDSLALTKIAALSFVNIVENVFRIDTSNKGKAVIINNISKKKFHYKIDKNIDQETINEYQEYNYGLSHNQINMLGGTYLHNEGFLGNGVTIAILDAGFTNVDIAKAFDSLWVNGQILGSKDFVDTIGNGSVFGYHSHGTYVLSILGGFLDRQLVGSAPKANYWLLRTEDGTTEFMIEEDNWVSAAEFADSVGADIINSSLGYTVFDDSTQNHTYADMNGNTARVTIGADIAASKGILVVNSAGNSGGDSWRYIGAPADGDSVMAIGAVNGEGEYATFSSIGPTFDGRVKPNVVAVGKGTIFSNGSKVFSGNGTSFSSPIIAGLAACLWQANPGLTNIQIKQSIEKSSSRYTNPDSLLGYGIPNFVVANMIASGIIICNLDNEKQVNMFPNPFTDNIYVVYNSNGTGEVQFEILDNNGRKIYLRENIARKPGYNFILIDELKDISRGLYILVLSTKKEILSVKKFIKKE